MEINVADVVLCEFYFRAVGWVEAWMPKPIVPGIDGFRYALPILRLAFIERPRGTGFPNVLMLPLSLNPTRTPG